MNDTAAPFVALKKKAIQIFFLYFKQFVKTKFSLPTSAA